MILSALRKIREQRIPRVDRPALPHARVHRLDVLAQPGDEGGPARC
jgi:hypothetical protein